MQTPAPELMTLGSEFSKGFRNQDHEVKYCDFKILTLQFLMPSDASTIVSMALQQPIYTHSVRFDIGWGISRI